MDKRFKSNFLKGSLSTSAGTMATIVFHFLSITFMARFVEKEALGLYFLILAVANAGKIMSGLGLDLTLIKFITSKEEEIKQDAFAAVIWTRLILLGVISVLVYFTGNLFLPLFDDQVANYLIYIPPLFIFMSFRELFFHLLQGIRSFKNYAAIQTSSAVLKFALIWFMGDSLGLLSLIYIEFAMLVGSLLYQLAVLPFKQLSPPNFKLNRSVLREVLAFGVPLYYNSVITYVYDYGNVFIIGLFLNPASIAAYQVALKIPQGFMRLFRSFTVVYYPSLASLFSDGKKEDAQKLMNKSLTLFSAVILALVLFSILFSQEIVTLVFTEKYLEIQFTFVLLMLNVCFRMLSNIMGYSLVSAGFPSASAKVNTVSIIINLGISFALIPFVGYVGAAYAILAMNAGAQITSYIFLVREGIYPRPLDYFKPALFLLVTVGIYLLLGSSSLLVKAALLTIYALLNFVFIKDVKDMVFFILKFRHKLKWQTKPA